MSADVIRRTAPEVRILVQDPLKGDSLFHVDQSIDAFPDLFIVWCIWILALGDLFPCSFL